MGSQGPSLGYPDPNSMLSPNLVSVRSGRVGVVRFGALPEIRVWARNSRLRVARTNLIADSDSTENFGSYRVFRGRYWYFYHELQGPNRNTGRLEPAKNSGTGNPAQKLHYRPHKTLYDPKFSVDSESALRFDVATRNHELEAQTGKWRKSKIFFVTAEK